MFEPKYDDDFKEVTLTDLRYIYRYMPVDTALKATWIYIKNWHRLLLFSDAVYLRITNLINKFVIQTKIEDINTEKVSSNHPVLDYDLLSDCKIFDYNYPSQYKTVAKCTNGDGILFGHYIPDDFEQPEKVLANINSNYLHALNAILNDISQAGIQPVVVFEPILQNRYTYNIDEIKSAIATPYVYDMTRKYGDIQTWSDPGHFNNQGRLQYSKQLSEILTQ